KTNITSADIRVPVQMRVELRLCIIRMHDRNVLETEMLIRGLQQFCKTLLSGYVVPADIAMTGVEAVGDWNIEIRRHEMTNRRQFGQVAAELGSRTGRVLEQNRELGAAFQLVVYGMPSQGRGFSDIQNSLFNAETFVVSRMRNQIFSANNECAFDLSTKGINGLFTHYRGWRRQIDQIAIVNDERREIMPRAQVLHAFHALGVGSFSAPHAGARGENLKSVCAQLDRLQSGSIKCSGG